MPSINTNVAALQAQFYLRINETSVESSSGKLSSGDKIVRAADDVAGLSIGTSLNTNVNALRTAFSNTQQADALLNVADGGLKNIVELLQRQNSLAIQATAGTLGAAERGFLNQEFQALTTEIDRTVDATDFNGVKLLDGSIFEFADAQGTEKYTGVASDTLEVTAITADIAGGETFTIYNAGNAVNVTLADGTGTGATYDASTNTIAVVADIANGDEEAQVDAYLEAFRDGGTPGSELLRGVVFSSGADVLTYSYNTSESDTVLEFGAALAVANGETLIITDDRGNNITLNGADAAAASGGNITTAISSAGVVTTTADLDTNLVDSEELLLALNTLKTDGNNGILDDFTVVQLDTNSDGTNDGVGLVYTGAGVYQGNLTVTGTGTSGATFTAGSAALDGGRVTVSGTSGDTIVDAAVNVSNIFNNSDFVGTLSGFDVTFNASNNVNISIAVGDINYTANIADTSTAGAVELVGRDSDGNLVGSFAFDLGTITVADQGDADVLSNRINDAFSTLTLYQTQDLANYEGTGLIYTDAAVTGDLTNTNVALKVADNSDIVIQNVNVTAPIQAGGNATIEVTINDEVFSGTITGNSTTNTTFVNGSFTLTNQSDPNETLTFTNSSSQNVVLTTEANAQAFEDAFGAALGLGQGGSGLNFQVGADAEQAIGVQVRSVKTEAIFSGAELDISTLEGAQAAATATQEALSFVIAVRADVGALQSRFDFAASNLETSIQNQEAATSTYLDADLASESTTYASAQVRLQASISILTQSNQLQQNLLKLIG